MNPSIEQLFNIQNNVLVKLHQAHHKNCNRCKIPKKPLKKSVLMDNKGNKVMDNFINANHKDDWNCYNCGNVNYAFRLNCNRCQMERENSIKAYNELEK